MATFERTTVRGITEEAWKRIGEAFEVDATGLYLKAATAPGSYTTTVAVDDQTVGTTPDATSAPLTVTVTAATHGHDAQRQHGDQQRQHRQFDRAREPAMGTVVTGQVGIGFRVAEIVDSHDLYFVGTAGFIQRAQDIPADTAVTVDAYFYRHS